MYQGREFSPKDSSIIDRTIKSPSYGLHAIVRKGSISKPRGNRTSVKNGDNTRTPISNKKPEILEKMLHGGRFQSHPNKKKTAKNINQL